MIANTINHPLVELARIHIDGGTQSRAALNEDKIAEYAEHLENGGTFPPIVVYYDGTEYWMADGFHRYHAAKRVGWDKIETDIRQGTRRDAILFSCGANAEHGLPRTNEDKRRQVMTLLTDEEWAKWSNREIARACRVSTTFVDNMRREVVSANRLQIDTQRMVQRGGTTYTMTVPQKPAPVAPLSDEAWDKLADTDEPPPVGIDDRIVYQGKPARVIGLSGGTLTLRDTDGHIRIYRPTEDEPLVKIAFPLGNFGTCPNCDKVAEWSASEETPGLLECSLCVHECDVDEIVPISETHPRAAEALLGAAKHFAYCPNCNTCHAKWQPVSGARWACKVCGGFVSDAAMQVFTRDTIPTTGSKEWMVARLAALGMNVYRVVKHQDGTFTAAFDLNGRYTEAEAEDAAARHGRAILESGYLLVKAGVNIDGTLYFTGVACPMVHFAIDAATFGAAMRSKLERIADEAHVDAPDEVVPESPARSVEPAAPSRFNSGMTSSDTPEWYTPADLMERVRKALWGRIDLDPASCAAANQVVQASRYFDREADGLSQEWKADTLWLNPPYGTEIRPWIEKLLAEAKAKRTLEALVLLPSRTDTEWFRLLRDYPRVFLYGRQTFWNESSGGNNAPFPSVIVGIGLVPEALERYFGDIGDVFVHFKERR